MIQEEGPGWRLARDTSRTNYSFLIGGEAWAIELTEPEWKTLVNLVNELINQHSQIENQLMDEETIRLELERSPWWGCLDGNKFSWSLKLIFYEEKDDKRGFEAFWPMPASQAMVSAMRTMWDSCY